LLPCRFCCRTSAAVGFDALICSRLGSTNPNQIDRFAFDKAPEAHIAVHFSEAILSINPGARRTPVNKTLLLASERA
jgi:hypothetical protein